MLLRSGPFVPLLLASLVGCGDDASDGDGDERLNVVLITLDTTRADALGLYGAERDASPRLDALGKRGTVFDHAVAQAAVTPVSHASILTGNDPYRHGLRVLHGVEENRLSDEAETLPEVLGEHGYATGAFLSAFPVSERFGFAQGFDHFDAEFLGDAHVGAEGVVDTLRSQRRADATTDRALKWLAEQGGPTFTWVHYFDPHDAMVLPPPEFSQRFGGPPRDERKRLRKLYRIEVAYMDQEIGRLLAGLDLSRTVVAVISDHGEGLGDHDWWTHGVLYEEQIRVPLIVHVPGHGAGRRVSSTVRSIDVMPTILEAVDAEARRTPEMDGASLLGLMDGAVEEAPRWAYADSVNLLTYRFSKTLVDKKNDMLFSVTEDGWKYIHHALQEDRSELYHLTEDPGETRNLYGQRPDILARLQKRLHDVPWIPEEQPGAQSMTAEDLERLRALGYTEGDDTPLPSTPPDEETTRNEGDHR